MTAKEIAAQMIAATSLTEETGLAPLCAYRREKRATGAPVDLEDSVVHAARECQEAADALVKHLQRAAEEATKNAAYIAEHGVRFGDQTWFVLDGRTSAESLNRVLRAKREHFQALVSVWAVIGDRIVATPEEQAKASAERMERETAQRRAAWEALPAKDVKRQAREHGLDDGRGKASLVDRLVASGIRPE